MKRMFPAVLLAVALGLIAVGVASAAVIKTGPPAPGAWQRAVAGSSTADQAEGLATAQRANAAETPIGDRGVRIAGNDRFETAVAISQSVWGPENAAIVFLAKGLDYSDALAGGASTLMDGPLLLVTRDSLPQVTADEISRLQPCLVIAFGGSGVISDAVIQQAQALTTATC